MHMNVSSNIKGFLMFGARTLSAAALFAAFAAQGDMVVGPWSRPNDYQGFLRDAGNGTFASCVLSGALWAILIAMPVIFCLVLRVVNSRFGKKPIVSMEYVVLAVLGLTSSIMAVMFFSHDIETFVSRFRDSPKLRAEYDQKCIDYYDTHDWSPRRYRWGSDRIPSIREGAPEAVTNAYRRFRCRVHITNAEMDAEIDSVTHGGE